MSNVKVKYVLKTLIENSERFYFSKFIYHEMVQMYKCKTNTTFKPSSHMYTKMNVGEIRDETNMQSWYKQCDE